MKVLHSITGTNVGGAEIMLYRFLRALGDSAADHAVVSLLPHGPIGQQIADLGVPIYSADAAPGAPSPSALMRLRGIIQKVSPDVIQGWMYHGNLAAKLATIGMRDRPAIIWAVHHSLQDIKNEKRSTQAVVRASAFLSGGIEGITYCSSVSQKQHEAVGFKSQRAVLIPNAIDSDEFKPDHDAKARLAKLCGIPSERIIIGNVARDHPMKDQAAMVRATADLLEKGYDVQAVIIGSGHSDGQARRAAGELGIDDWVTTFETRSDIAEIVPGFDIFLLSSGWGEAFPLAVGEALAAGVPAVVTDVGDSGWLVGDCGIVVPPGDAIAQSAGVEKLLKLSDSARKGIGLGGRDRVRDLFSMDGYIAAHDELYKKAVQR